MILEVEPIHLEQKVDTTWSDHPLKYDVAEAKLIRVLKGTVHGADHGFIFIEPYFGAEQEIPPQLPEALIPGRRALVLLEESSGYEPDGRFVARRCGVLEDTPTNLSALKVGMAQDITVRHPIAY